LPSLLIRTAHVAWLPAAATLQPLPLLLLATVACCCWVLFLFLFVCWSVLSGLCIFVLREEEGLQERKKETKKERRESLPTLLLWWLLASFVSGLPVFMQQHDDLAFVVFEEFFLRAWGCWWWKCRGLGGEGVRRQAFIVLLMVGFWLECEGLDLLLLLSAGGK
jgi:hypothetical protein